MALSTASGLPRAGLKLHRDLLLSAGQFLRQGQFRIKELARTVAIQILSGEESAVHENVKPQRGHITTPVKESKGVAKVFIWQQQEPAREAGR